MHNTKTTAVTPATTVNITSNGERFQSLRTPRAFVWVEAPSPTTPPTPTRASPTPRTVAKPGRTRATLTLSKLIAEGSLTKEERQFCRKVLAGMQPAQAAQLVLVAERIVARNRG